MKLVAVAVLALCLSYGALGHRTLQGSQGTTTVGGSASQSVNDTFSGSAGLSLTGSGTAQASSSAKNLVKTNLNVTAVSNAVVDVLTAICSNNNAQVKLKASLTTFASASIEAFQKCSSSATTTGNPGNTATANCKIDITAFQEVTASALLSGFKAWVGTQGGCGQLDASGAATLTTSVTSQLQATVFTYVKTYGTASASAVSAQWIEQNVSTWQKFCQELVAKVCSCAPTCYYCSHPDGSIVSDGSANVKGEFDNTSEDNQAWLKLWTDANSLAVNKGCGQKAEVSIWADVLSKATARIYSKVFQQAHTTGTAVAISGYTIDAVIEVFQQIWAQFTAASKATYAGSNPSCLATAAATVTESIDVQIFTSDVLQASGLVKSENGVVYAKDNAVPDAYNVLYGYFQSSPYVAKVLSDYGGTISSTCTCPTSGR
jgi:hypothetical protein